MNIVHVYILIVLYVLSAACTTTGKVLKTSLCTMQWGCGGAEKIEDPTARISNSCVSVLPPRGEGWSVVRKNGWWIADTLSCTPVFFGKGDKKTSETYIAYVAPFKLPEVTTELEFLELTGKRYSGITNVERYDVIKFEERIYEDSDELCSIHSYLVKDRGVPEKYRTSEFMYLENIDINCRHPYDEKRGVTVSYSHRYNPGQNAPEFSKEALEFFKNVEFLE